MTLGAQQNHRFEYKIKGIDMQWEPFTPLFLPQLEEVNEINLAEMNTIDWKGLNSPAVNQGIGIIHFGLNRYTVAKKQVAKEVVERLWPISKSTR